MIRDGLSMPSEAWLRDVKDMDKTFCSFHPNKELNSGSGVTKNLVKHLCHKFPNRNEKVVSEFVRLRTRVRIRTMNYRAKFKKI